MNMPNILCLKDLVETDAAGNTRIELIAKAVAMFSTEFLNNTNFNNPEIEEYLHLILAEITKHTFEFLISMPLNKDQAEDIKKQIMDSRFKQIMEESAPDNELKH